METVCLVLQGSCRCDTIIIFYKTEYISFVLYEFFLIQQSSLTLTMNMVWETSNYEMVIMTYPHIFVPGNRNIDMHSYY